jgi:hypothetical protein
MIERPAADRDSRGESRPEPDTEMAGEKEDICMGRAGRPLKADPNYTDAIVLVKCDNENKIDRQERKSSETKRFQDGGNKEDATHWANVCGEGPLRAQRLSLA